MPRKVYAECVEDNLWGEVPKDYKEGKTIPICPKCNKNIPIFRTENPIADGLRENKKVELLKVRKLED